MTFSYLSGSKGASAQYTYNTKNDHVHQFVVVLAVLLIVFLAVVGFLGQLHAQLSYEPPKVSAAAILPVLTPEYTPQPEPSIIRAALIQPKIEQWVSGQQNSTWSVYFKEVGSSDVAGVSQDQTFQAASLYKLYTLPLLHAQYSFSSWQGVNVADKTMQECVFIMISRSDNPCGEALVSALNPNAIHRANSSIYKNTSFLRNDYFVTTAHDTGSLLENVYTQEAYSDSRAMLLEALGTPKSREGIRSGCDGCEVFNKTGEYGNVLHDAAIIKKNGKTYVLAVLSENGTWQQVTDLTQVITDKL